MGKHGLFDIVRDEGDIIDVMDIVKDAAAAQDAVQEDQGQD